MLSSARSRREDRVLEYRYANHQLTELVSIIRHSFTDILTRFCENKLMSSSARNRREDRAVLKTKVSIIISVAYEKQGCPEQSAKKLLWTLAKTYIIQK